jgi:hypothetical protein
MFVSQHKVELEEKDLFGDHVLLASEQVLGNGQTDDIRDVVYVKPDTFTAKNSGLVAAELDDMNRRLLEAGRPYLLIVIGRLGSVDPWLGIPVEWAQVAGAKVIVETSTEKLNVDMSQGSHFFHNVMNLQVYYFSADKTGRFPLRWDWLQRREAASETTFVRHVALDAPLHVSVDGKSGRGVICHERSG